VAHRPTDRSGQSVPTVVVLRAVGTNCDVDRSAAARSLASVTCSDSFVKPCKRRMYATLAIY
jgi:hypothetical protein